jgi:hypothetical protein
MSVLVASDRPSAGLFARRPGSSDVPRTGLAGRSPAGARDEHSLFRSGFEALVRNTYVYTVMWANGWWQLVSLELFGE